MTLEIKDKGREGEGGREGGRRGREEKREGGKEGGWLSLCVFVCGCV